MNFKFIIFVGILGVCLTQGTASHPNRKPHRDIIEEIIKAANEAVYKLKILVDEKYQQTTNLIANLQTDISHISSNSLDFVLNEIKTTATQTADIISNTAAKAQENNIDIVKCLKQIEEEIRNIVFLYTKKEEEECIYYYNNFINNRTQAVIEIILRAEQYVHDVAKEVQECAISADPLACGMKVISDISDVEKQLPKELNAHLIGLDDTMRYIPVMLANCGSVQFLTAGTQMFKVINKVATCIN